MDNISDVALKRFNLFRTGLNPDLICSESNPNLSESLREVRFGVQGFSHTLSWVWFRFGQKVP
jgi:hypothetical protein